MSMVIKVRFRRASKLYDFDPNELELHSGDKVMTETVQGIEMGECASEIQNFPDEMLVLPLKPILRIATEEDLERQRLNEEEEKKALEIANDKILEQKLEMKLVDVEYAFDRSRITFYFTANGRVDFRSLVKNLAGVFRTRIELRQIGVRDEAKMLGGIGPCGRPICCRTYLGDFPSISIKMAKEQNLSLNPAKISGLCDRLMCCLKYEQDHYEATRKRMPKTGKEIMTPDGIGTVSSINALSETVRVRIAVGDSFEQREYPIDACSKDLTGPVPPLEPEAEEELVDTEVSVEAEEPAVEETAEAPEEDEEQPRRSRPRPRRREGSGSGERKKPKENAQGSEAGAQGKQEPKKHPKNPAKKNGEGKEAEKSGRSAGKPDGEKPGRNRHRPRRRKEGSAGAPPAPAPAE